MAETPQIKIESFEEIPSPVEIEPFEKIPEQMAFRVPVEPSFGTFSQNPKRLDGQNPIDTKSFITLRSGQPKPLLTVLVRLLIE